MGMNYNKFEYLELLKKKSIGEKLNSEESSKLLSYSIQTSGYLNWCIWKTYLDLLENFQKGKIETFDFCISSQNIGLLIDDITDILESNLIILSPNEKSSAFSDLLNEVLTACGDYLQDADFNERVASVEDYEVKLKEHEIVLKDSEVHLKNSVEKTYLKIQTFLN